MENRIKIKIESTLEESQSGFYERMKHVRPKIYLAIIDLEKAYDKVTTEKLWNILKKR